MYDIHLCDLQHVKWVLCVCDTCQMVSWLSIYCRMSNLVTLREKALRCQPSLQLHQAKARYDKPARLRKWPCALWMKCKITISSMSNSDCATHGTSCNFERLVHVGLPVHVLSERGTVHWLLQPIDLQINAYNPWAGSQSNAPAGLLQVYCDTLLLLLYETGSGIWKLVMFLNHDRHSRQPHLTV